MAEYLVSVAPTAGTGSTAGMVMRKERVYDLSWQLEAKCARDPEVYGAVPAVEEFFLDAGRADDFELNGRISAVKDFCTGARDGIVCPVLEECLAHALINGEKYGIWGGKDLKEREDIRSRRLRGSAKLHVAGKLGSGSG